MIDDSPDESELMEFKRRALRDAVICIGWLKIISTIYYISMYYMVHIYSKGDVSTTIQVMVLTMVPLQILHGIMLFYGAVEDHLTALELSLWCCIVIASLNTILGTVGSIYFIRNGTDTMHFLIATAFVLMACSLFTVILHDILIVYAYKQIVSFQSVPDIENVQLNCFGTR